MHWWWPAVLVFAVIGAPLLLVSGISVRASVVTAVLGAAGMALAILVGPPLVQLAALIGARLP